jgi:hypothetical protein
MMGRVRTNSTKYGWCDCPIFLLPTSCTEESHHLEVAEPPYPATVLRVVVAAVVVTGSGQFVHGAECSEMVQSSCCLETGSMSSSPFFPDRGVQGAAGVVQHAKRVKRRVRPHQRISHPIPRPTYCSPPELETCSAGSDMRRQ